MKTTAPRDNSRILSETQPTGKKYVFNVDLVLEPSPHHRCHPCQSWPSKHVRWRVTHEMLMDWILSLSLSRSVYGLVEARSGLKSNCTAWTSAFASDGVVRSPVGSTPAIGFDAIRKQCEAWNQMLGPQGNGWYPMELWSSNNEVRRFRLCMPSTPSLLN